MRGLVVLILGLSVLAGTAAAAPCARSEKLFQCHARAVELHLGAERPADPAGAKLLYADACAKGHAPSCNNLAVLALVDASLAAGVDPGAQFAAACKRLDLAACENERRLPRHRDLAVQLTYLNAISVDEARMRALHALGCKAGDLFKCDDAASRQRVGALLVEECRKGREPSRCYDAATTVGDQAPAYATLMRQACKGGEGQACYELEQWRGACRDDDFSASAEDVAARNDACTRWAKQTRKKQELLAIAKLSERRCEAQDAAACAVAKDAFKRAGASAKLFALVERQCEDHDRAACEELGDLYVLGIGTRRSVEKRIELVGAACLPPADWRVCKLVAVHHQAHPSEYDATSIRKAFCEAGNDEACYDGARAAESAKTWCTGPWDSAQRLEETYRTLCTHKFRDACRRAAGMCDLAMRELIKSRRGCHWGMGDGVYREPLELSEMTALCPAKRWTPAVRAVVQQEASRRDEMDRFQRMR